LNANDAAATAKHMGLTAAKILFAQTAKGQGVLTNDKALVERLDNFFLTDQTPFRCDAERAARLIEAQAAEIEHLRELLAAAYIELSGKDEHASDCATSNAPAMMPGRCDCD
jgi:hypothetical protein